MQRVMRSWAVLLAASLALARPAFAQDEPQVNMPDFAMVWFTSYACPDAPMDGPGATPETAIEPEYFQHPYEATFPEDAAEAPNASPYECRWVRLRGFFRWLDYYHYRGVLHADAPSAYFGGAEARGHIIESLSDANLRRATLAQRDVTLVGRFYDLCAAAERAQQARNQIWMTFGPCHYGADRGLMLRDVRIETIHDPAPRYIVGAHNRGFFQDMVPVQDGARAEMIAQTRDWGAFAQRGPEALADQRLAEMRASGRFAEADVQRQHDDITDPDSYASYLAGYPRFRQLDLRRAPVEVFWSSDPQYRERAYGCLCLVSGCDAAWPVLEADMSAFLGDAVCTQLRLRHGVWEWD